MIWWPVAYLGVGIVITWLVLPGIWRRAYETVEVMEGSTGRRRWLRARSETEFRALGVLLLWPGFLLLSLARGLARATHVAVDNFDPERAEREVTEAQERRLAIEETLRSHG